MRSVFSIATDRQRYADYHRRLDVMAVLQHYGLDNEYEQTNSDGTVEGGLKIVIDLR